MKETLRGGQSILPETESLLAFLAHVRRRHMTTELVRHSLTALVFGLAGLVVLLLAGTQIFDWYWPVLLFVGAFGLGVWQFQKHKPTLYRLAQIIDSRLQTHDSLSTAFYFQSESGPMVEAQRAYAARLAGTLSPETAVPMVWPKTTYAVTALAVTAGLPPEQQPKPEPRPRAAGRARAPARTGAHARGPH